MHASAYCCYRAVMLSMTHTKNMHAHTAHYTLSCNTTNCEQLANAAHDDSDNEVASDNKAGGPLRPNGWSTYQASWLESDDTTADADNAADSAMMDFCNTDSNANKQLGSGVVDAEEHEKWHNRANTDGLLSDDDSDNDSMDMHDDAASTAHTSATSNTNKDHVKLESDEKEFPDEVNTPDDIPARKRFARYRALRSFRSSPWDPQESLPRDYARIFQVSNILLKVFLRFSYFISYMHCCVSGCGSISSCSSETYSFSSSTTRSATGNSISLVAALVVSVHSSASH
jgi:40S ribosome biogenesis protein Tsr1 and BMS1 C-terminal